MSQALGGSSMEVETESIPDVDVVSIESVPQSDEGDDEVPQKSDTLEAFPDRELYEWINILSLRPDLTSPEEQESTRRSLLTKLEEQSLQYYYEQLCERFKWSVDQELMKKMQDETTKAMEAIEKEISTAREQYGDVEVKDAMVKKANYLCKIGSPKAVAEYRVVLKEKAMGVGEKIDVLLTFVRLGHFNKDTKFLKESIVEAKEALEKGGDWERKNRLKIYEGLYLASTERKLKDASDLFIEGLAAFSSTEILSFEHFIQMCLILGICSQPRPTLKSKLEKSPEVLQVLAEDRDLTAFFNAFMICDYRTHFQSLIQMCKRIQRDHFLAPHFRYIIRLLRLKAYEQFLVPYHSITLSTMANNFGISEKFLERELVPFIETGKLGCKIDAISNTLVTKASDKRSALYQEIIKSGDALLNKVQTLARVIDL